MNDYKKLIDNLLEEAENVEGIKLDIQIFRESAEAIKHLQRELADCRNVLCIKCGQYKQAHLGACDGCRWKI